MSKAKEFLEAVERRKQYRTRIKEVEHDQGTRHIKNLIEQAKKRIVNVMNPDHDSPNPRERADKFMLGQVHDALESALEKLKKIKETRRKIKETK